MQMYAGTTCTLSENCHAVGVSTQRCDVLLNPFQSRYLVFQTGVAWSGTVSSAQKTYDMTRNVQVSS
jgi:hypothetical protein